MHQYQAGSTCSFLQKNALLSLFPSLVSARGVKPGKSLTIWHTNVKLFQILALGTEKCIHLLLLQDYSVLSSHQDAAFPLPAPKPTLIIGSPTPMPIPA